MEGGQNVRRTGCKDRIYRGQDVRRKRSKEDRELGRPEVRRTGCKEEEMLGDMMLGGQDVGGRESGGVW